MKQFQIRPWLGLLLLAVSITAASTSLAVRTSAFDQIDLLVDVRHELVSGYVEQPDEQAMAEAAVRAMIDTLDDPYTTYINPEQLEPFDREIRGTFSGIGAEVRIHPDEQRISIISPLDGSPAWRAGVMAGDVILEIDGTDTTELNLQEAVDLLLGPEGSDVTIKVRHESGQVESITITRAQIDVPTVKGLQGNAQGGWQYLLDPDNRIGYIRLAQFTATTPDDLQAAIEQLLEENAAGIILDLRFDPGGMLEAAVKVSDMFLPAGKTIVSVRGRSTPERTYNSTDEHTLTDLPLVVLANEASASASEIVTGALLDNQRATFVGTRTFGKGSVQQVKMLPSGQGAIKITNAYYYLPSGRNIHRRPDSETWGVDPKDGFYVPMTADQVRAMNEQRRQLDILRTGANSTTAPATQPATAPTAFTPELIREDLKDLQLAAALETIVSDVDTGLWARVGEEGAKSIALATARKSLARQRKLLEERLAQIDERLEFLANAADDPDLPADAEAMLKAAADAATEDSDQTQSTAETDDDSSPTTQPVSP